MSDDKTTELRWEVGQVWERDGHRWRVDIVHGDFAVLQSLATPWARTHGVRIEDHLRDGWKCLPPSETLDEQLRQAALSENERLKQELRVAENDREDAKHALWAAHEALGIRKDSTTSDTIARITALDRQQAALQQQLEAVNERLCIPKNSTWSAQLNAVIQLHEKYEDVRVSVQNAMRRMGIAHELVPSPEEALTLVVESFNRQDERVRATTQYIVRITGAKGPLNLEDAVELLAGHPKHPQGILGAVRDELSAALAEVERLKGELWLAESDRDESARERDKARQEVVSARLAVLLSKRLGGMLALRTEDEIFLCVEGMAVQNTGLLREREQLGRDREAWAAASDNALNLGAELRLVENDLKATREHLSKAIDAHIHATADRSIAQARADNAERERDNLRLFWTRIVTALGREGPVGVVPASRLAVVTDHAVATAERLKRECDDAAQLWTEMQCKLNHALGRQDGELRVLDVAKRVVCERDNAVRVQTALQRELNEARAVQTTLRSLLETINAQLSLPANAPWETTLSALKAERSSADTRLDDAVRRTHIVAHQCHLRREERLIEDCANIAQEEAREGDRRVLIGEHEGSGSVADEGRAMSTSARSIERKIRALVETKR